MAVVASNAPRNKGLPTSPKSKNPRDTLRTERDISSQWWKALPVRPQRPCGAHAYDPFFVPKDAMLNPRTQTSALLKLPPDLLLIIVEQIGVPWIQVAFSLTCKQVALLISQHTSILAPWRGFRDKEALLRILYKQGRYYPGGIPQQVQSNRLGVVHILDPWMPSRYRPCRACFRFVPRSRGYWQNKLAEWGIWPHGTPVPTALPSDIHIFLAIDRTDGQNKCPECVLRNNTNFMRESTYRRAEHWTTCDGDPGTETVVKPDLKARIDRP